MKRTHAKLLAIGAAIGAGLALFIASPFDDLIFLAIAAHFASRKKTDAPVA